MSFWPRKPLWDCFLKWRDCGTFYESFRNCFRKPTPQLRGQHADHSGLLQVTCHFPSVSASMVGAPVRSFHSHAIPWPWGEVSLRGWIHDSPDDTTHRATVGGLLHNRSQHNYAHIVLLREFALVFALLHADLHWAYQDSCFRQMTDHLTTPNDRFSYLSWSYKIKLYVNVWNE